jgi:hypothetical protein
MGRAALVAGFLILLLAPGRAWGQSAENVLLEPNEQLFDVLAAINAAIGAKPRSLQGSAAH